MKDNSKNRYQVIIERDNLYRIFDFLKDNSYQVVGPTIRDGAIVLDIITSLDDLPVGWGDQQEKGFYRLQNRDDAKIFKFNCSPQSWRKYLFPPEQSLFTAYRTQSDWQIKTEKGTIPKYAFLGMRPCDLHALKVLDKVLIQGDYADPIYKARRGTTLTIIVNCDVIGETCFCTSMGTGPKAESGFDLALAEVVDGDRHYFVVEAGSTKGESIVSGLDYRSASGEEIRAAEKSIAAMLPSANRRVDTENLPDILNNSVEHPHWKSIAKRCLTCGNCTMVCPTCFCTTIWDYTDLKGENASRLKTWDSCFNRNYSYLHGGSVRYTAEARYRHWLMHKFTNWIDQFGSFGCVGCGRCITWCTAGIDVTEEIDFIRKNQMFDINVKSA